MIVLGFFVFGFLSGFSFTNIHESLDRRVILNLSLLDKSHFPTMNLPKVGLFKITLNSSVFSTCEHTYALPVFNSCHPYAYCIIVLQNKSDANAKWLKYESGLLILVGLDFDFTFCHWFFLNVWFFLILTKIWKVMIFSQTFTAVYEVLLWASIKVACLQSF